jgi:hypothetical protein
MGRVAQHHIAAIQRIQNSTTPIAGPGQVRTFRVVT